MAALSSFSHKPEPAWFDLMETWLLAVAEVVGDRWQNGKFGFHMIATIAEQFTGDLSDREQSPTMIWKSAESIFLNSVRPATVRPKPLKYFADCFYFLGTVKAESHQ